MAGSRSLLLVAALASSACAEIEFGVPNGGAANGGAGGSDQQGGGGASASGEQCLNGVDDDDDGAIDCADSDCASLSCIQIPDGWFGPVELRADDSPCEGDFSEGVASLKTNVAAQAASCACSCEGELQNCNQATLVMYGASNCQGGDSNMPLSNGQCSIVFGPQGTDSYRLEPADDPACSAAVATTLPEVTFDARRLCQPSSASAGCDGGTCAPSAACIYTNGNATCPTELPNAFTGSAGLVDSRDCSLAGCACGAAQGGCELAVEIFEGPVCEGTPLSEATSPTCENLAFTNTKSALYTSTPGTPVCTPSGNGTPTGAVSPSEPITVCCAD